MKISGVVATVLLLLVLPPPALLFKDIDFKDCVDAAFCVRNRGRQDGREYTLMRDTLVAGKRTVSAMLRNDADESVFKFELSLLDEALRVQVTEPDSPVGRFQVPNVLVSDPPKWGTGWEPELLEKDLRLNLGRSEIVVSFTPFLLVVSIGGHPSFRINSRGLLHIERHRVQQEDDPGGWWEETFRSHRDSKPNGPQAISFDLEFTGFQHVYGIPEHATSLSLKPTVSANDTKEPYRLYNLDVFEYLHDSPFGLYGSIPFMLAHRADLTVGAFWLDSSEMFIDVEKGERGVQTQWIAESGVLDLFLLLGPLPSQVLSQYAQLTGTTAMPQLFALGYHQCRWNYNDEADVLEVDANFDAHAIPYDVLWLDIEHTDAKKYLTWDSKKFPDPMRMQEKIALKFRKMVTIVDPHMKRDSGYVVHKEAERLGHYVKNKDGGDYEGWCWPGSSSYLDVLNPEVRNWWANHFLPGSHVGATENLYIWNDMNEPSVFNGPEITMHKDCLHLGKVEHRDIHNLYGYLYHLATVEGLLRRGYKTDEVNGDRPFVLSRAFFAGTQTLGPVWTGDNTADWDHMRVSVPMLLSLGLTGLPFAGADVGGFFGNPDEELLTRWTQLAAFTPFFRQHAHIDTKRREIWLFGDQATDRMRKAIQLRYSFLPYLYTLFRAANVSGQPILRPLWFEFPENSRTFDEEEEFLLGPSMLVRPVLSPGAQAVDVYLPPNASWFDGWTGLKINDLDPLNPVLRAPVTMEGIPFYFRGGSIIPRKDRPRRNTFAMRNDAVTLLVVLDDDGVAAGDLYLDDGHSFAFRGGAYVHKVFRFENLELTSSDILDGGQSTYATPVAIGRIVILGLPQASWQVTEPSSGEEFVASSAPVTMEPGLPKTALVVRRLNIPITSDWRLKFSILD